jgi:hypothetical protein
VSDGLTPEELARAGQARDDLQEWWEWAERELKEVDDLFKVDEPD